MNNYTYNSNKRGLVGVDYTGTNETTLNMFDDITVTAAPVQLEKINKRQFEKLYFAGVPGLFILSNRMHRNNVWQAPAPVIKSHLDENNTALDSYINNYKYYNCDSERGHGVAYYVDINNRVAALGCKDNKIKFYLD